MLSLCLASLAGQDPPGLAEVETPLPLRQDADAGLARIERSGQVVQLRIAPLGPIDSPMIEVPVVTPHADWRFAATRDRRFLVGIAGGIRDDLELYLIDRLRARWLRYPTDGGRLLPERFDDGRGSWPQLQGGHVALFAFARHGRVELRVLDFEGRVLATASLPEETAGIEYRFEPESYEILVGFRGATEPLRMPHPMAPWLEIVESSVEFADVALHGSSTRELTLHNRGRSNLELAWSGLAPPFAVLERERLELAPEATGRLRLRFTPQAEGPAQTLLRLTTNGPLRRTSVLLRGRGIAEPEPVPAAPPPADPVPADPPAPIGRTPGMPSPAAGPPPLQQEAGQIVVRCGAAREFLLAAVSADGAGRLLAVWRARTDAAGEWRAALATLAGNGAPFHLVLLWHEQGRLQRSQPLVVR